MPNTTSAEISLVKTYPIIGPQLGIWLADQLAVNNNSFTVAQYVVLSGDIHSKVLNEAIKLGLKEADTVHSLYQNMPDGGIQTIDSTVLIEAIPDAQFIDLSNELNAQSKAIDLMHIDIDQAPRADALQGKFKHIVFKLPDENGKARWLWYQRYHHLMLDGFSFTALTQRIASIYSSLLLNRAIAESPFTPYQSVIEESIAYDSGTKKNKDKQFWQDYCQQDSTPVSLSYRQSNSVDGLNTNVIRHQCQLPVSIASKIQQHVDFSMADIASTAVLIYLSKMSGEHSLCIGYPFMRRMGFQALTTLGTSVNVLPLNVTLTPDYTFNHAIEAFTQQIKKVRRHQQYEAEQVQRDIGLAGSKERLYSATLNCKLFDYELDLGGVKGVTHQVVTGPIEDIELGIYIDKGDLSIELSANASRYTSLELQLHANRLIHLLSQYADDAQHKVARNLDAFSVVTENEETLLATWSNGPVIDTSAYGSSIVSLLAKQASDKSEHNALVFEGKTLSFDGLYKRVNQLSRLLISHDVQAGDLVAVALPRSIDSIVSIFAIMNIGAVYLPLDLSHPPERLAMMCEDKVPSIALSTKRDKHQLPNTIDTLCLDDASTLTVLDACYDSPLSTNKVTISKQDLAYVFYTSGSTGRPKGVMVSHGALINLIAALEDKVYSCLEEGNRQLNVALTGSLSFDTSWDPIILMALGHNLHIYSDSVKQDVYCLLDLIEQNKIDTLAVAPSLATQLVQAGLCDSHRHQPKLMDICGEPVPPSLWQALRYSSISSHNIYGPTEFAVYATSQVITSETNDVTIGQPFANTCVYILDKNLQPVPLGVNGELYLAGDNMSSGYLNRPDITASRFVANPFVEGAVMYVTGDIVRWSAEGQLVFVGRCDSQVKIRGFRIELGDVESALSCLESTKEVAVMVEETDNNKRLLAYCTLNHYDKENEQLAIDSILQALNASLPSYMVPSLITLLAEMPLTVSGKINKKALPKPTILSEGSLQPKTPEEMMLCQQMANILSIDSISLDDDFFKMAGDSISAMRLSIALNKLGYVLKPQDIFSDRTAGKMVLSMNKMGGDPVTSQQVYVQQIDKSKMCAEFLSSHLTSDENKVLTDFYGDKSTILPTLPLQAGLLFHSQITEQDSQYSFTTKVSINGEINKEKLQESIALLIIKYPQLAAQFDVQLTGKPIQIIPPVSIESAKDYAPIIERDVSHLNTNEKISALYNIEMNEAYRLFNINGHNEHLDSHHAKRVEPLLFFTLVKIDPEKYELLITAHHLIIDGWSTPLLLRELFTIYGNEQHQIVESDNTYRDVVVELASRDTTIAQANWKAALDNVSPMVMYADSTSDVNELSVNLDDDLTDTINDYCQQNGVTLNTLIQGVWGAQLGAMSGRDQVVFGSPVSGRFTNVPGIEQQIGLFSNTLPVTIKFNSHESVLTQLIKLQTQQINLMSDDCLGLGEIQHLANIDTLFDTLLVVENYPAEAALFNQSYQTINIDSVENRGYTHYPLTILVLPSDNIRVLFEYRDVVSEPAKLAERFIQILSQIVNNPSITLAQLSMQTKQDVNIIEQANNTEVVIEAHCLRDLLRKQANSSPHLIALKDQQRSLTYQEMRQEINHVSLGLFNEINREQTNMVNEQHLNKCRSTIANKTGIIGVAIPRSCELSIALQSVIEIGCAYLPLDSSYPNERLALMLSDANVEAVVTTKEQASRFSEDAFNALSIKIILIEELMATESAANMDNGFKKIAANDPAYIIYTSGSTGKPKGVVVSHQAIVNRLLWMQDTYQLTGDDVVLQKTPSSFDVSVWEFFWPLIQGATLFMAPPEAHRDPEALMDIIVSENISTLHFVPSMLAAFIDHTAGSHQLPDMNKNLKRVFCSGEALSAGLVEKFESICNTPLHNLYGPTEAAVDVTYYHANQATDKHLSDIPIGLPVWNTKLRILDHQLRPVGVGCVGELYLTGQQLANGYLNRPDITADRFVADPLADGQRMYRTGDIAKWLSDGNVVYLGRTDDQLKIRGLRVEVGEIEQALLAFKEIKQIAVHARNLNSALDSNTLQDSRQLVAYYIAETDLNAQEINNPDQILTLLSSTLPAHMVPIALIEMTAFPLSANGKLDKKSLPDPDTGQNLSGRKPSAGIEATIAHAFEKLLNLSDISAQDSFFNLGGHSLMAMKLAVELRASLELPVSVGQIMVSPTIEGLAAVLVDETLRNDPEKAGFGHILPIRQGQGPALICINPGSGFSWQYTGIPKYLEGHYPVIGLQSPRPNGAVAVSENMDAAIEHYYAALKRVQPIGPYHFLGYSFGGTVAVALAAKLERQNEQVSFVGLLDTYPPEGQEWKRPTEDEAREEVEREKSQFLAAAENEMSDQVALDEQSKMFNDIVANYDDTVRLLSKATSQPYHGKVHLFVAEKTLPEGWDEEQSWAPFVKDLVKFRLPYSHADILSPAALERIGPMLSNLIKLHL